MSVAPAPSYGLTHRASATTLIVGVCVSLAIHLGLGYGASEYFASVWDGADSVENPLEIAPEQAQLTLPKDQQQVGMRKAQAASINWLGVIENPELSNAPIAQVEQAEFTKQIGNTPVTISPEPYAQSKPVIEDQRPVQQPIQAPQQGPASPDEIPNERVSEPTTKQPAEQIKLEPDRDDSAPITITPQFEPVEDPPQEPEVIESVEHPAAPELASAAPEPEPESDAQTESNPSPSSQSAAPKVAGKEGVVSKKESAASIIKRAIKVDARSLHRPIVGKGLEIITVEPRFPASVRFTEMPRNPVLMIQFDARGRVSKAYFLKEGKRVYDTGTRGVDEPLMNAIYQWRAKGKQIEMLDPKDPDSVVEISMRITFRKERDRP